MPKMTHPKSAAPIDVAPTRVATYLSQGWSTTPKSPTDRASGKSGTAPRTNTKKKEEA